MIKNGGEALHVCGSGVSAVRALRTCTLGNLPLRNYPVAQRELPSDLVELIFEYLPLKSLPKARVLSTRSQRSLANVLSRNLALQADFEKYLRADEVKCKRVWVAVRVKPQGGDTQTCLHAHHNRINIKEASGQRSSFFYDSVFNQSATQLEVWSLVKRPVMASILARKNVCFFAYGQTGSGKTHTMFGDREIPGDEGIAFRAVRSLAALINGVDVAGRGWLLL